MYLKYLLVNIICDYYIRTYILPKLPIVNCKKKLNIIHICYDDNSGNNEILLTIVILGVICKYK